MVLKNKAVLRQIGEDSLLIPVGSIASKYSGIFTLSPVAATAYKIFEKGGDFDEALAEILKNYEVDEAIAMADLTEFVDMLRSYDLAE